MTGVVRGDVHQYPSARGTVSTIWGCPIEGPTKLEDAVQFTDAAGRTQLRVVADELQVEAPNGTAKAVSAVGRANLKLCGSHCGVSIGEDGPSQMGLEDLASMRAIFAAVFESSGVARSAPMSKSLD